MIWVALNSSHLPLRLMEDAWQVATVQGFADVLGVVDTSERTPQCAAQVVWETSEKLDAEVLAKNFRSLHSALCYVA
jgi:hypothetical protein